jgi:DNA-directed RNA polymerase specialized sigma24 family protein
LFDPHDPYVWVLVSLRQVSDDSKREAARKAVKVAQKQFDRESSATQRARRKAFTKAQKEGLSLREIGDEVGLHRSRVGQIISGK